MQYIVKQHGLLENISCFPTWLPPYKTKEILQSLVDTTLTCQSVSTYSFGRTFIMGHFACSQTLLKITCTITLNF